MGAMSKDDIRNLLGGYATGTLTPEERDALLSAALEDQELFNALADEEALRQYLADPAFRRDLLTAMDERKVRRFAWLFRPVPVALAGSLAAAALVVVSLRLHTEQNRMTAEPPLAIRSGPRSDGPAQAAQEPVLKDRAAEQGESRRPRRPDEAELELHALRRTRPAAPSAPPKPVVEAKKAAEPEVKDEAASRDNRLVRVEADKIAAAQAPAAAAGQLQQTPGGGLRQRQQTAAGEAVQVGEMSKERAAKVSLRLAAPSRPRQVTEVTGTAITLNIGAAQGIKLKDKLVVLRNGSQIGEVEIAEVTDQISKGTYSGSAPAQIGDMIR